MKLRSLVLFGAGIMTGLAVARKLTEDDPAVVHGPTRSDPSSTSPRLRIVTSQAHRLADRASVAIQRARVAIRDRLGEEPYDEVNWN